MIDDLHSNVTCVNLNRLEHGIYNLSRMRESATKRYKVFQIPIEWMMDTGFVTQVINNSLVSFTTSTILAV